MKNNKAFMRLNKQEKQILKQKYMAKYGKEQGLAQAGLQIQILESHLNHKPEMIIV